MFNIARGIAPGAVKHGPILANDQIQLKTCGLMLAVGQPIALHLDPWGDAPGYDDEGRWPTIPIAKAQLQNSRFGL
ncbi:hypothetical protein RISK_006295 [Rhodopirellula islandica]|uniref:Uncharacterized protein n=1 Tax=Rhodopirellula islandica TaxID=595434 RepID=A0A0J1B483_RHOIS|nr:hypothetical protein RISK_006295 [Rhodopirellula islandica]